MKHISSVITALSVGYLMSGTAYSQSVGDLKAICVEEKATGFNWRDGAWVQANFKPGKKILVQRLDLQAYESKPPKERPMLCKEEPSQRFGTITWSTGCYLIKDMGSPTYMFNAEMCTEMFEGKVLATIQCKRFTFHPDGAFIAFPWHVDIDTKPKDGSKDSLVLAVGTCSRLAD